MSPAVTLRVSIALYFARQFDNAIASARRAIELDSTFMFAYDRLHWALDGKGDLQDALTAAERASAISGPGDVRRRAFAAYAYGRLGRRQEAETILAELISAQKRTYVPPTSFAAIHVGLGQEEEALDWLQRGYDSRDGDMVLLKTFPLWDPLRGHRRFQELVSAMGFPE
ncbi:MAG: tetratricopeptide repeat protein [Gemmatimonadota bacterium]